MQLVSAAGGVLRLRRSGELGPAGAPAFTTGLTVLDALAPNGAFARGCVHELLSDSAAMPRSVALLLARAAVASSTGVVVWCDPAGDLYPPALAASGLPADKLFVLRVAQSQTALWSVAECLRCRGVAATIAAPARLSRVEARRLQLAAERGGGVGILLRRAGASSTHYAAATRWLVTPARGDEAYQRWRVRLVHGHGGQVGKEVVLEVCRDTNHVRAVNAVADRPTQASASRASA